MEERRQSKQREVAKGRSFDDLVDEQGLLKDTIGEAKTTAAQPNVEEEGLRKRTTEALGAAMGAETANPFADEMHADFSSPETSNATKSLTQPSRESTATVQASSPASPPAVESRPEQPRLLIDTEEASNHSAEQLLDVTPTTSASSARTFIDAPQPSNYWSVNEWAESTSPSFYSPPQSEGAGHALRNSSDEGVETAMSDVGSGDDVGRASQLGSESDMDVMSEVAGGVSTPGSWTDVGSVVSEDGQ